MAAKRRPPVPTTPLPPAYAYPLCCGQPTRLSPFGWHCAGCGTYLPFRDVHGKTLQELRLAQEGDE
jgi:hypothetical protein